LSTLALRTSDAHAGGRSGLALRYADLALLVAALPVFVFADWPLLGYAVAAVAWAAQRAIQAWAAGRAARDLAAGERRSAMGVTAGATLGRVWLVTASVLAVGLIGDREDGLAAAVLAAALFTVYFAGEAISHLTRREGER
jgi:hypothetical protein